VPIIQSGKNIRVESKNSQIKEKFNSKYGEQIAKLKRLEADRRAIERDLQKLDNKIKSHNRDKKGLSKVANAIKKLEEEIEIEQSKLDDMIKAKSSLEEVININWDKISDMIPYSNLLSLRNK